MKKMQHDTVRYYIEDAFVELRKILHGCKNKKLREGDFFPLMEHALEMLNCAFNCRFISRKKISQMSQKKWEKYLSPPKEIFARQQ